MSALVLVLVLALGLLAGAVLVAVLILILILVLVVHCQFLRNLYIYGSAASNSIPGNSGFILGFKKKTGDESRGNRCGNAACCCFQPTCQYA